MRGKSRLTISYILLIVFALYYANICFFYHYHVINGTTIVHSHFHSKAHTKTGTHTDGELTLISVLSAFQSSQVVLFFGLLGIFLFLQAVIFSFFKNKDTFQPTVCVSLRAPPFMN